LTIAQAQRRWALEHSTCVKVFDRLVDTKALPIGLGTVGSSERTGISRSIVASER
jgi:hypothetical protein